jgi:hypothetical protein
MSIFSIYMFGCSKDWKESSYDTVPVRKLSCLFPNLTSMRSYKWKVRKGERGDHPSPTPQSLGFLVINSWVIIYQWLHKPRFYIFLWFHTEWVHLCPITLILLVLLTNEWVESGINLSMSRYSRCGLYQNPVFSSQIPSPLLGDM